MKRIKIMKITALRHATPVIYLHLCHDKKGKRMKEEENKTLEQN